VKSKVIRIGETTPRGYTSADLYDAWRRYLPPLTDKPATSATAATPQSFQDVGVADAEFRPATHASEPQQSGLEVAPVAADVEPCCGSNDARNPHEMGVVAPVADVAAFPGNGGDGQPGLSWRAVDQMACEIEEWAYSLRHQGDIGEDQLRAKIGRRLTDAGIFPEAVEVETQRVLQCLFETGEARRHTSK
jgi:hypothetical protein